jgi:hypothetical protein
MDLEGEEVLWFGKRPIDYPFGVDNDFHHFDCVNFFHPWVIVIIVEPNIVEV